MNERVKEQYLPGVGAARRRFFQTIGDPLVGPDVRAQDFELFLLHFCALGVHMTEPVEGWIHRAGERCEELGLSQLGRALKIHAAHEANHHLMMINDTRVLTARWNERHDRRLDVNTLLQLSPTPGVEAYVQLHEDVIASRAPFGQLAIEYEIEGLSVSLGPPLMRQCERLLGREAMEGLSFLREHIAIDVGHTKFNEAELERVLAADPNRVEPLCRAGSAALDAYGRFLQDCFTLAKAHSVESSQAGPASATMPS